MAALRIQVCDTWPSLQAYLQPLIRYLTSMLSCLRFFFLHFLMLINIISWADSWNKSGIFKDLSLCFFFCIMVFIVIYQRDPVSSYGILGFRKEQCKPCSILAGPEGSALCKGASAVLVSSGLLHVQFSDNGKWVDNWSGSLLVQQLILKLCWKQWDLIVLGLCRCTISTGICVERASVLMADVLETSRQIFGFF